MKHLNFKYIYDPITDISCKNANKGKNGMNDNIFKRNENK